MKKKKIRFAKTARAQYVSVKPRCFKILEEKKPDSEFLIEKKSNEI